MQPQTSIPACIIGVYLFACFFFLLDCAFVAPIGLDWIGLDWIRFDLSTKQQTNNLAWISFCTTPHHTTPHHTTPHHTTTGRIRFGCLVVPCRAVHSSIGSRQQQQQQQNVRVRCVVGFRVPPTRDADPPFRFACFVPLLSCSVS